MAGLQALAPYLHSSKPPVFFMYVPLFPSNQPRSFAWLICKFLNKLTTGWSSASSVRGDKQEQVCQHGQGQS